MEVVAAGAVVPEAFAVDRKEARVVVAENAARALGKGKRVEDGLVHAFHIQVPLAESLEVLATVATEIHVTPVGRDQARAAGVVLVTVAFRGGQRAGRLRDACAGRDVAAGSAVASRIPLEDRAAE